jgi:hypothetical protein
LGAHDGVIDLGDGEGDLAVGIDEGDDLEFEDHVLVIDSAGDVADVVGVGDGLGGVGDLLARGDDGLFVVEGKDRRPGEDLEAAGGLEGGDVALDGVGDLAVDVESLERAERCGDEVVPQVGDVVVVTEEATAVSVLVPATSTPVAPLTAIMVALIGTNQLFPPVHTNESEPVATFE